MARGGVDRKPYPTAVRLYAIAALRWAELDGHYAGHDLIRQPPHRFCNFVFAWAVQHMTPEQRERWEYEMALPLPGEETTAPAPGDIKADSDLFMAALGQKG